MTRIGQGAKLHLVPPPQPRTRGDVLFDRGLWFILGMLAWMIVEAIKS